MKTFVVNLVSLFLSGVTTIAMAESRGAENCKVGTVVEVVSFSLQKGLAEAEFLVESNGINSELAKQAGFISRQIAVDERGEWIDIVKWRSLESAKIAADQMMANPKAAKFFSSIDQSTIKMVHYCLVSSHGRL